MQKESGALAARQRWLAFAVLSLGTLMIVLDTTIVNVALPSIRADLGLDAAALAWVVNAYLLTFGGFLLLSGRLGDLYGKRRLFLAGIVLFTLASLACGLAGSQAVLVAARALQGLGGAAVSAISLSLVMTMFPRPEERARAMGFFGFIAAGGGSVGVLLGGVLTGTFDWHWIFLVNVPIGLAVIFFGRRLLPANQKARGPVHLDIAGAASVTVALLLAVYAVINGNQAGWASFQTIGLLAGSGLLLAAFIWLESRAKDPLMPLHLFRAPNVAATNAIGVLWAAAMFAWFFLSALYLQLVLGYTPLQVGLAFLPANVIMAVFSAWLSAKVVLRFGFRRPLAVGLLLAAVGLALFSQAPVGGSFILHVLPGMVLLGIGAGLAFNPLLLAAMGGVRPEQSGLASGVVNTAFMMGGALGLAILASLASFQTSSLLENGAGQLLALNEGYHIAFLAGAGFALLAAILGAVLVRDTKTNRT
ncbi:MAG: MFS transporter [Candidatus Aenigmarchaeota archaeon]|nr:MFS transporter [Candidatus Aenigmarchaeota archaeon]